MENKINERLSQLQAEYAKGQGRMNHLEQELASVKASMLRISGAIQVLQELQESKEGMSDYSEPLGAMEEDSQNN